MTTVLTDDDLFTAEGPADDLADLLHDAPAPADRFAVVDESSAAWVVNKMLTHDEEIARLKAQYKDMLKGLEAKRDRFAGRFTAELEAWFESQPKKGKTLKLLTGTLSVRTVPGGFKVADAEAATAWAIDNLPNSVERVSSLKLDTEAVLARAAETGEVIPGVEYVDPRESFSVKAPASAKKEK